MASVLLCGFVGANVFAWVCLGAMSASGSGAAAMEGCDMEMPDAGGIGVRASLDCCLSCIADAGLLDTRGFELPPLASAPGGPEIRPREFVIPALGEPAQRVVPPEGAPPVILLTGSLLI